MVAPNSNYPLQGSDTDAHFRQTLEMVAVESLVRVGQFLLSWHPHGFALIHGSATQLGF